MNRLATRIQWLAMVPLALDALRLDPGRPLSWPILALLATAALTLLRRRSLRERRLVALLQLLSAGLLAALRPGPVPGPGQAATGLLAVAGLLALDLDEHPDWWLLLRRGLQGLLLLVPLGFLLIQLLPRLAMLVPLPGGLGGSRARTGLSPVLDPGGIAELATSDAAAARVAFRGDSPPPPPQRYWRVLVHERFDGRRWTAVPPGSADRLPPPQPDGTAPTAARELWVEEPSRLAAMPWSGAGRPARDALRISAAGELLQPGRTGGRRVYVLGGAASSVPWRRRPPSTPPAPAPKGSAPRLEALGARWARLEPPEARLRAAEQWFRSRPFRYTLRPGTLPRRAPLDAFLFERRQGFCGHYASAFTALMRAAGLPARVVSGYRGGTWVRPRTGEPFLEVRRRDAHAWSEVWLAGRGWVRVDPSSWVSGGTATADGATAGATQRTAPFTWLERQWWGLDLRWSRWWLGFDGRGPAPTLGPWLARGLPLLAMLGLLGVVATALAWLGRRESWRPRADPLRRQLDRWLALWARRGMAPRPGETLRAFAVRLERRWPQLAEEISPYVEHYERLRFAEAVPSAGERPWRRLAAARRSLGRRLRRLGG